MNKTKLQLTQHRGNLRLWIESKALAALLGGGGSFIRVEYAKGEVTISAATEATHTNVITGRSNGAAIIDLNSAKLTQSLGAKTTHANIIPANDWPSITIRPAK